MNDSHSVFLFIHKWFLTMFCLEWCCWHIIFWPHSCSHIFVVIITLFCVFIDFFIWFCRNLHFLTWYFFFHNENIVFSFNILVWISWFFNYWCIFNLLTVYDFFSYFYCVHVVFLISFLSFSLVVFFISNCQFTQQFLSFCLDCLITLFLLIHSWFHLLILDRIVIYMSHCLNLE